MSKDAHLGAHGWIGFDLDGTLAEYDRWRGHQHIGKPLPLAIKRAKGFLGQGKKLRIVTARVGDAFPEQIAPSRKRIEEWCLEHIGVHIPVTCKKDQRMVALYDDRAQQCIPNTGETLAEYIIGAIDAYESKSITADQLILHIKAVIN